MAPVFVSINSELDFLRQSELAVRTILGRKMCTRSIFVLLVLISCPIAGHAATLSPDEASSHLNENATVCGLVASATYAA
jgi:hypothetical protein